MAHVVTAQQARSPSLACGMNSTPSALCSCKALPSAARTRLSWISLRCRDLNMRNSLNWTNLTECSVRRGCNERRRRCRVLRSALSSTAYLERPVIQDSLPEQQIRTWPSTGFKDLCTKHLELLFRTLARLGTFNSCARAVVYLRHPDSSSNGVIQLHKVAALQAKDVHGSSADIQNGDCGAEGNGVGASEEVVVLNLSAGDSEGGLSQEQYLIQEEVVVLPNSPTLVAPLAEDGVLLGLIIFERMQQHDQGHLEGSLFTETLATEPFTDDEMWCLRTFAPTLARSCALEREAAATSAAAHALGSARQQAQALLRDARGSLATMNTYGTLLMPRLEDTQPDRDMLQGMLNQSKRLKEVVQQLQVAFHPVGLGPARLGPATSTNAVVVTAGQLPGPTDRGAANAHTLVAAAGQLPGPISANAASPIGRWDLTSNTYLEALPVPGAGLDAQEQGTQPDSVPVVAEMSVGFPGPLGVLPGGGSGTQIERMPSELLSSSGSVAAPLTIGPTLSPVLSPTPSPTLSPTPSPTLSPTPSPTSSPTLSPTTTPTLSPTSSPTLSPTTTPTLSPTLSSTSQSQPPAAPPPTSHTEAVSGPLCPTEALPAPSPSVKTISKPTSSTNTVNEPGHDTTTSSCFIPDALSHMLLAASHRCQVQHIHLAILPPLFPAQLHPAPASSTPSQDRSSVSPSTTNHHTSPIASAEGNAIASAAGNAIDSAAGNAIASAAGKAIASAAGNAHEANRGSTSLVHGLHVFGQASQVSHAIGCAVDTLILCTPPQGAISISSCRTVRGVRIDILQASSAPNVYAEGTDLTIEIPYSFNPSNTHVSDLSEVDRNVRKPSTCTSSSYNPDESQPVAVIADGASGEELIRAEASMQRGVPVGVDIRDEGVRSESEACTSASHIPGARETGSHSNLQFVTVSKLSSNVPGGLRAGLRAADLAVQKLGGSLVVSLLVQSHMMLGQVVAGCHVRMWLPSCGEVTQVDSGCT